MTKDNKTLRRRRRAIAACALLAVSVFAPAGFCGDLPTKEITSNNIYGLAGSGDTLWMVTDQGVNYTIATSDTLTWSGYKAPFRALSFAFGARNAVMCLDTTKFLAPNKLWFYSHLLHSYDSLQLAFNSSAMSDSTLRDSAVFMAAGVVCSGRDSAFWIACEDAGLARFTPSDTALRLFFPGVKRSFDPASVRIDSLTGIKTVSDLVSKRIIAVAIQKISKDTTAVLALTQSTLYRFFPQRDSSWDTLPSKLDGSKIIDRYNAVFASNHSPFVFADISAKGYDKSKLYRFDPAAGGWIGFDSLVTAVTFGPDSVTYVVSNNQIKKYSGTLLDTTVAASRKFVSRVTLAMGGLGPGSINDILYLPRTDSSGSFWIAMSSTQSPTWNGLLFSRHEERDEQDSTPFVYVRHDPKISTGLKQTYAVPGILSSNVYTPDAASSQAVFAYSLSKAANVTITVYDWNMNLVKNIVTNRPRLAGADDPTGNGRSTNRREDVWNGTNSSGKRVAVGVYYFKITATSGERSFGKIIVAK